MIANCDALMNLVNNDAQMYCQIIFVDFNKKVAWVHLEEDHNLHNKDIVNIQSYDEIRGLIFYEGLTKEIQCKVQIIRKKTDNNFYLYGCKFLNDEIEKAEIRKMVFKKQIENKKKYLDLG